MPSAGRILRVSIAGVVAAASLGISAASASAGDVWLWACHGPNGQALTAAQLGGSNLSDLGQGCDAADVPSARAGYTLKPATGTTSSLTLTMPNGLSAKAVQLNRTLRGFEGSTSVSYRVSAGSQILETNVAPGTGVLPIATPASSVTLDLNCSSTCGEVDVISIAVLVTDDSRPTGGVSWNTPVDHEMVVTPSFTDSGAGLDRAELTIGGRVTPPVYFNSEKCRELSPADGTNDRPLDVTACRIGEIVGDNLPPKALTAPIVAWKDTEELDAFGNKTGKWIEDPLRLPEGLFPWTVIVYDVAGNPSEPLRGTVEVWHPPAPVSVRTLNISTASVTEQPGGNNNTPGGSGGVQGSQASQCRSPRLSVILNSKPVRVSKNVPVLLYKKAYKFTGRLTCVINGKRQSAPKRTKLSILNKVGKKTVRKPNTAIRAKGAVNLKLAFVSSRTVIFRYTNASGQKSEVKIKVRVTKKKK